MSVRKTWVAFWDLQCPYSKANWKAWPSLKEAFESEYDMTVKITSLAFHPQAFTAQCAFSLIETKKGRDVAFRFVDTCFENQDSYMNAAVGDARKSEINGIFASLAEKAQVLDDSFTKSDFLENLNNWDLAVKPAYTEHKVAMAFGVFGTPKHVIDDQLLADTESAWGVEEWRQKLKKL
jgi:protein-disulfide isomerase